VRDLDARAFGAGHCRLDLCQRLLLLEPVVAVHEMDGLVPELLEVLEFRRDVPRAAGAPLALVEDRDAAEQARPRTAT
jgi:hypothetical protein